MRLLGIPSIQHFFLRRRRGRRHVEGASLHRLAPQGPGPCRYRARAWWPIPSGQERVPAKLGHRTVSQTRRDSGALADTAQRMRRNEATVLVHRYGVRVPPRVGDRYGDGREVARAPRTDARQNLRVLRHCHVDREDIASLCRQLQRSYKVIYTRRTVIPVLSTVFCND